MIKQKAAHAKKASILTASLSSETKNAALTAIAHALRANETQIITANQADLAQAQTDGLEAAMLKRLKFDADKLNDVLAGIESLKTLPDPIGQTQTATQLDDGLELYKVTCPIGVLGIVFESRPDALVQISTLALKSGNAVLLKGGKEAAQTNRTLADIIYTAGVEASLPEGWMALLETREDVAKMLALDGYVDLIVPRGSNAFVKYVMDNTSIPVLGHADGICHVYVDSHADLDMAVQIAVDSKCQYPAVCNAMETLLVDQAVATEFLPLAKAAYDAKSVELRGDEQVRKIISAVAASEADWRTEYGDLTLSIKVVSDLDAAIEHINIYGSRHTDAIVTNDEATAKRFMALVDSANVFWNCSTRFADGFRYGLGAEVGISTSKIHARGPVGLEGLTIYKWKLTGKGHIVADYAGPNARAFTHKAIDKRPSR